jgi:enolase-phosphatase E1
LFLVFQKDLIKNSKENVQDKPKQEQKENKTEKTADNKKEEDKKQEINKDEVEDRGIGDSFRKKDEQDMVALAKKIKENPYGLGKDFKIVIKDEKLMPTSFSFTIEYAGLTSEEFYMSKALRPDFFEVNSKRAIKEFEMLKNYGTNNAAFNKEVLDHLMMDEKTNQLKKAIKDANVDLNNYLSRRAFESIDIRFIPNAEIKNDPLGRNLLSLINNRDYIAVVFPEKSEKWLTLEQDKSRTDLFESIVNKRGQQLLIRDLMSNNFIKSRKQTEYLISVSDIEEKMYPSSFYIVYSVILKPDGEIMYKEERRSVS